MGQPKLALVRVPRSDEEEQGQDHLEVEFLRHKLVHLERGLQHSRDIGVAMGIVMVTANVTRECAFDLLRMVSRLQKRKLSVVAAEVVQAGGLPVYQPLA